jgi:uncharacterized membrane protein
MKKFKFIIYSGIFAMTLLAILSIPSCTHDPFPATLVDPVVVPPIVVPPVVVPPVIKYDSTGVKCDPNEVYFEKDVYPIIKRSCAVTGCHGGGSTADGVNLDNYTKIIATGGIRAGNPSGSKFFTVLTASGSKLMPPPPTPKLTTTEIAIINKWITAGAKNVVCNPNFGNPIGCDTTTVTYSGTIKKIMDDECVGCHKATLNYASIRVDTYDGLKAAVAKPSFIGSIKWSAGYVKMPQGRSQLDACTINKINKWIKNGAKND